ncbi:MAG TPA: hypothetical protein PLM53_06050 [Spirochaetota bacterium]|nr:hypothetical protein [Spirochaetota bacterium]HPC39657.1 hypothetical protein [Spirochaetota bacterium]HPL17617.1 hypothetical protein [Spirochaetota bacterium]HQF07384.1 hypothetical protein [Spirochaetota bacterium]HQH96644.1 hypothetical protein [Spirochaetota bacterium]
MIDEIALMRRVFDRYRVSSPLSGDVQRRAMRMKRKNLVSVMKKLGIYSPLYGMILSLYFFLKKLGIGLSIMQSAVLFFTASAVVVSSVAAGGYLLVGNVVVKSPSVYEEHEKKAAPAAEPDAKSGDVTGGNSSIAYRYRLQFYGLENNGADGTLVAQVSDAMRSEIIRLKGRDRIAVSAVPDRAGLVLTGSVEKLDRQYLFSIRLTERRTRRIIFAASEESATAEGLRDLAVRFAQSVAGNIQ